MTTKLKISDDLSLPMDAVTQTFGVLAKRGAGKTYCTLVMAEEMLAAGQQIVFADPVGVAWGIRSSADGKGPGLPIVILGGDHGDLPLESTAGEVVADLVVDERISVVLDLSLFRKGEQVRFMTSFAETLYRRNRNPLHLFLDEADEFAPQKPQKGQERMLGAIEDLVRRGRARGVGITMATQRSAVLNKDVLTQIEVLVALRTVAPQDRAAIDAWIKVHGTPEQRDELMKSLPSLPIGTAWFWSPGWLDVFQQVKIRTRRTFDSSATPKTAGSGGKAAKQPKQMAEVDLASLQVRMKATIERAAADDPKLLKKKIVELEKQVAHQTAFVNAAAVVAEQQIDVIAVEARANIVGRMAAARSIRNILTDLQGRVGPLLELIGGYLSQVNESIQTDSDALDQLPPESRVISKQPTTHDPTLRTKGGNPLSSRQREKLLSSQSDLHSTVAIPKGELAILTAVAQHGGDGCTREQLTVLTGYKRSSRDTYIQRLRERGFVETNLVYVQATSAGIEALGSDFEPLPTGESLRDYWLGRLPEGQRRILEVLIRKYPAEVLADTLSDVTGYKRSSRDTYLQRLRSRQLVITARGTARASAILFD